MATPSSETADDSDPLYTGSESADEPHGVSAQSQGVLRVDSGASDQQEVTSEERSSSDQQIAENFELPVELRLSYKPPTVSLQGARGCECLTSSSRNRLLECGGCPTGCGVESVDGEPNYLHSSSLATSPSNCCSYGVVKTDGGSSDCFYLNDTGKNGGQIGMNTENGSLTITDNGELFQKIHKAYVKTKNGDIFEVFALRSSTSNYLLAVDTHYDQVKGIIEDDMRDPSNCCWRIQPFCKIGKSAQQPGDIALQYWGKGYGPLNPNTTDGYYFIIKIQPSKPTVFMVAEKSKAAVYGRFTYSRP